MNIRNKILLTVLIIITISVVLFLLATINRKHNRQENSHNKEDTTNHNNQENSLVLYFSATGTTKKIAEYIKEETASDIIEIIPEEKYTQEDLNYHKDCRANREQKDTTSRPKIANTINVSNYETIYLGYPIWWGDAPKIILSLLETNDFTGKTIIPFCTSGGSSIIQSVNTLKEYSNIHWNTGQTFHASSTKEDIKQWVDDLNRKEEGNTNVITLKINHEILNVALENNSSATAFAEKLRDGDIIIEAHDYSNFEKVGNLNFDLPTNDTSIQTQAGDLILYQGNKIVLYYDTNTWNFTKIGRVQNKTQNELKELLGDGNVTLVFSMP